MNKVYEIVTERITRLLEQGTVPWHKPWKDLGQLVNYVAKRPYRGINVFLLAAMRRTTRYWLTYRQCQELGGQIKSGEKSAIVVFWNWVEKATGEIKADGSSVTEAVPFLKYYRVFNLDQCEGIALPDEEVKPTADPIASCETIVEGMPHRPSLVFGGNSAFYQPLKDVITLPPREQFIRTEEYYSTLFHEMTHSTGHSSRLNRKTLTDLCPFGSTNYSREELVAEMGAAFLCAQAGIENHTIDNSAAYVQNWLGKLNNDKKLVVLAASQAQRAVDYVLGHTLEEKEVPSMLEKLPV